ncbi:MAG: hypothetical protein ABF291_04445 [Desulfobacterales bacterium]
MNIGSGGLGFRACPPVLNNAKYQNTSTKIQINSKLQYPKIAFIPQPSYETTPKWHSFFLDQTGRFSGQRLG